MNKEKSVTSFNNVTVHNNNSAANQHTLAAIEALATAARANAEAIAEIAKAMNGPRGEMIGIKIGSTS